MKKQLLLAGIMITIMCIGNMCFGQTKKIDACTLISAAQVNSILGCKVLDKPPVIKGYCNYKSADNMIAATINATAFSDNKVANDMLKLNFNNYSSEISHGKKAIAVYENIEPFPQGGANAHYMTGKGDVYVPGDQVRLQFVSGNALITFDTKGIDKNKVIAKLPEIYKIMSGNYK